MSTTPPLTLLAHAAEDRALEHSAVRVLAWCLSSITTDRFHRVKAEGLAPALAMRRETVSRALRSLASRGYLVAGPRLGHVHTYRLSGAAAPFERTG